MWSEEQKKDYLQMVDLAYNEINIESGMNAADVFLLTEKTTNEYILAKFGYTLEWALQLIQHNHDRYFIENFGHFIQLDHNVLVENLIEKEKRSFLNKYISYFHINKKLVDQILEHNVNTSL